MDASLCHNISKEHCVKQSGEMVNEVNDGGGRDMDGWHEKVRLTIIK